MVESVGLLNESAGRSDGFVKGERCGKKKRDHHWTRLFRKWYYRDSNLGHTDFQSVALPTEL